MLLSENAHIRGDMLTSCETHPEGIQTIRERYESIQAEHTIVDNYEERRVAGSEMEITPLLLDIWLGAEFGQLEEAQTAFAALSVKSNSPRHLLQRWKGIAGGSWYAKANGSEHERNRYYGDCIALVVANELNLESQVAEILERANSGIGQTLEKDKYWPTRITNASLIRYRSSDVLIHLGYLAQTKHPDVWGLLSELKQNRGIYNPDSGEWNGSFETVALKTKVPDMFTADESAGLWEALLYCQLGDINHAKTALDMTEHGFFQDEDGGLFNGFGKLNYVATQLRFLVEAKLFKLEGRQDPKGEKLTLPIIPKH